MAEQLKYKDITEKIIGASFEVHKFLGNGFQEVIYQRALAWELDSSGFYLQGKLNRNHSIRNCQNQLYKESGLCGRWQSIGRIESDQRNRRRSSCTSVNYLRAYKPEVELLLNLGTKGLTCKRLVL